MAEREYFPGAVQADLRAEAAAAQASGPVEDAGPTLEDLREQARQRGVPVSGTKAELEKRLAEADQGQ